MIWLWNIRLLVCCYNSWLKAHTYTQLLLQQCPHAPCSCFLFEQVLCICTDFTDGWDVTESRISRGILRKAQVGTFKQLRAPLSFFCAVPFCYIALLWSQDVLFLVVLLAWFLFIFLLSYLNSTMHHIFECSPNAYAQRLNAHCVLLCNLLPALLRTKLHCLPFLGEIKSF